MSQHMLNVIHHNGYTLKRLLYHTSLITVPDLMVSRSCAMMLCVNVRCDTLLFIAITTSLPLYLLLCPHHTPADPGGGGLKRSIISSRSSATPPPPSTSPLANGTNLYSLSDLMSSHAERWPYQRASGSHHLSPSPVACQAQHADGQAEGVRRWGGGPHLSPFSCKLL